MVQLETNTQAPPKDGRPNWWLAAAAAALILGVIGYQISAGDNPADVVGAETTLASIAPSTTVQETGPAAAIEDYVAAYNTGDLDGVMAMFTEDSVLSGHPLAIKVAGLSQIRAVQMQDIESSATENAYTISNVEVSGNTVTWDHRWIRDDGVQFCQLGHTAVVEDGKILSWTWPDSGFECS